MVGAVLLCALLASWIIGPVVEAQNTHSIDLELDNGQYLSILDANQTGLDVSDALTFETWVKFESLPPAEGTYFINKRLSTGSQRAYSFLYSGGANDHLSLVTFVDGSTAGVNVNVPWIPSTGVWYHVAVSKTGTTVNFYVDGQQIGSTQNGSNSVIYNSTANFSIGHDEDNNNLDGLFDDVRVWNVARTHVEIAANMNKELVGNEPGLVGYWKFNGSSLEDATANNNDLTNNGAMFSTDVPFNDTPAPTLTFNATPSTITEGGSATLSWDAQNATTCTASGGWIGSKGFSGSEIVSPLATTLYTLDCTGDGGNVHKETTVSVDGAPATPTTVRKSVNESVSKSATLQNDDALILALSAGKTYAVEGVVFVSAGKSVPDLRLAFTAPSGSDMTIGYLTDSVLQNGGGVLTVSGASSRRIQVPANSVIPIMVRGTVVAGAGGDLQLKWAQFTSNANPVTVTKGSYLTITEI